MTEKLRKKVLFAVSGVLAAAAFSGCAQGESVFSQQAPRSNTLNATVPDDAQKVTIKSQDVRVSFPGDGTRIGFVLDARRVLRYKIVQSCFGDSIWNEVHPVINGQRVQEVNGGQAGSRTKICDDGEISKTDPIAKGWANFPVDLSIKQPSLPNNSTNKANH